MKTIANKEILVAADFAGCPLKNVVKEDLEGKGWKVTDIGVQNPDDPEDPALMFHRVGLRAGSMISEKEFERALLFCGTGMGIHIAASKCPGVHAGVVESVTEEPFRTYVTAAGRVVGVNYALDEAAQRERENLIEAIKYNLVNRYEYPYELLVRRYNLPVSLSTFKREKKKYCYELARLCGFIT